IPQHFVCLGALYKASGCYCFAAFFSNVHDSLLEVGAGLRDNGSGPSIVVNPAMFGFTLPASSRWRQGVNLVTLEGFQPSISPFSKRVTTCKWAGPQDRGIQRFASLNAPNSKRNVFIAHS